MARAYGSSAHLLMKRETVYGQPHQPVPGLDQARRQPGRKSHRLQAPDARRPRSLKIDAPAPHPLRRSLTHDVLSRRSSSCRAAADLPGTFLKYREHMSMPGHDRHRT
jgi:hypothetical protein